MRNILSFHKTKSPPSVWIFWNSSLGLITISDWTNAVTISDKNLWATTVWNDWDSLTSDNCGNYYQWWNNYAFPWISWSIPTTSSSSINTSAYWPDNYYNSSSFITVSPTYTWAWDNLWGNTTDTLLARRGPTDDNFHIPSKDETVSLVNILASLGITTWASASVYLKMPFPERRQNTSGAVQNVDYAAYWTSTSARQDASYNLLLESTSLDGDDISLKGQWYVIRPFYNRVVSPNESTWWTELLSIWDIVVGNTSLLLNSKWGISDQKNSTYHFGYTPIYNLRENRVTTWFRATSTVADEYWTLSSFNKDWTIKESKTRSQWWFSRMDWLWEYWLCHYSSSYSGYWWNMYYMYPSSNNVDYCQASVEWDWGSPGAFILWVSPDAKYVYIESQSSENRSWENTHKIYVLNTSAKSFTTLWRYNGIWRYKYNKRYETKSTIRCYMRSSWNGADEDYWWCRVDIDKATGTVGAATSMSRADIEAFTNTYPTWEYSDLTNMSLLINFEEYSWWAYFNWEKVWTSWYFQRGRDNVNQEYIYRPVNLVTSSNSWWWGT